MDFGTARNIVVESFITKPMDLFICSFMTEQQMKRRIFKRGVRKFQSEINSLINLNLQGNS